MSKLNLTKEEATKEIKAVKQCNMVAREKRAKLRGFASSKLYLDALQAVVNGKESVTSGKSTKKKTASKAGDKPVILVIDVLDRSGSMGSLSHEASKIAHAVKGINQSVENLKAEEPALGVIYKHVFIHFDTDIVVSQVRNIGDVPYLSVDGRGGTSLNDAIIKAINKAIDSKQEGEKALINIYTDGGENSSRSSKQQANNAIKQAEKQDVVVTFVGTKYDTQNAIRDYGLHESNTLSYDGTARGMSMSVQQTSSARSTFSKKVVSGEDVRTGFYKKIVK